MFSQPYLFGVWFVAMHIPAGCLLRDGGYFWYRIQLSSDSFCPFC